MRLLRYQVTEFRSVKDSGIIEADAVTALIGTNESGKTNLLLPLWKFNPAKEGKINFTDDYPRKQYGSFRDRKQQPVFITAWFEPTPTMQTQLAQMTGAPESAFDEVAVQRRYSGEYIVTFPQANPVRSLESSRLLAAIDTTVAEITAMGELKTEQDTVKPGLLKALTDARSRIVGEIVDDDILTKTCATLAAGMSANPAKTSTIVPRYTQLVDAVNEMIIEVTIPAPSSVNGVQQYIIDRLPTFVYYSNYGNLDSKIYLPRVIADLDSDDLTEKEQAKARTLKVLFEFVKLKPQEILDLGRDISKETLGHEPTEEEIAAVAERKRQRSILHQSASADLTTKFREWWKQGEYNFRFEADGDHFRIWVSDKKRPDEIELEGRSTGLQWFLSFYLVFLVESADEHQGSILLLDEPGLSLHPMAQRDLSVFFESLATENQLLFTTHSPFLVDADHLDRARKVYVDEDGYSRATPDLRSGENDPSQRGSNYTVAASLGISVAESLLLGCAPVIVEGQSDQIYLSAIKTVLIAKGRLKPARELVFPPADGTKGVKAAVSVLGAKGDDLPLVLVDSDYAGDVLTKGLRENLYKSAPDRVVQFGDIVKMPGAEVEDLIPCDIVAEELDRLLRAEAAFKDSAVDGQPLVPQIKAWATSNTVALGEGWKVHLAKRVKSRLL